MINAYQKRVLILAVRAGELMMKSGAEVYRVEDTIQRICKACKVPSVDVFALPTGIFVTLDGKDEDGDIHSQVKRLRGGADTDLDKISKVNSFSRKFTTTDLTIDDGMVILEDIEKAPAHTFSIKLLGAALATSFFSLLFDGSIFDFLCAPVIGCVSYCISYALSKFGINFFIRGLCSCAVAAFFTLLVTSAIPAAHYNPIMIGIMMLYVPGVAITNSMREFLAGDIISGVARLAEAFLVAISLATGAGIIFRIWSMIGGVTL